MKKNFRTIAITLFITIGLLCTASTASASVKENCVPVDELVKVVETALPHEVECNYANGVIEILGISSGHTEFDLYLEDYLFDEEKETVSVTGAFLFLEELSKEFESASEPRYISCTKEIPEISSDRMHAVLENFLPYILYEEKELGSIRWYSAKENTNVNILCHNEGGQVSISQAYALAKGMMLQEVLKLSSIEVW